MVMHYNTQPIVVLVICILIAAVLMGFLLSDTEVLNPARTAQEVQASATAAAVNMQATLAIQNPTQTRIAMDSKRLVTESARAVQATDVRSTAVAFATSIAVGQTATRAAVVSGIGMAQGFATQTRLAVNNRVEQAYLEATANALIARQMETSSSPIRPQMETQNIETSGIAPLLDKAVLATSILGIILLASSLSYYTIVTSRIKLLDAQVREEREQRHTLEVKLAIESKRFDMQGKIVQFPSDPQSSAVGGSRNKSA